MKKLIVIILVLFIQACGSNQNEEEQTETTTVVKATIKVTSLPDSFTYDLDNSPNGGSEYQWSISFDIDNDAEISEGDISFQISLIAFDDTPQKNINRSELKAHIWEYGDGVSYISTRDVEIDLITTSTSITFIAPTELHVGLKSISNGTQVYVDTIYRDQVSGVYYYDFYPNKDTFTEGLDTGFITDDTLDFETNIGAVNGVSYPLIDIESLSVVIEEI